jgi:hypothetical protein
MSLGEMIERNRELDDELAQLRRSLERERARVTTLTRRCELLEASERRAWQFAHRHPREREASKIEI